MVVLLANTNIYFNAFCAFLAVMSLIGFMLIRTDKKRWKAHEARSNAMMAPKRKPQEGDEAQEDTKKGKKRKKKEQPPEEYEYQDRIPDKWMFAVAVLFGGIGEILAMLIYRHKWYKFNFRVFIPILVGVNIVLSAIILYELYVMGDIGGALVNGV